MSRRGDEGGFLIVECVVAVALLMIVLLPAASLLSQTNNISADIHSRIVAAGLASQQIDLLTGTPFASLPINTTKTLTQKVNGITYTVTESTSWTPESVTTGGCDNPTSGGTGGNPALLAAVSVSWPDMGVDNPVESDTLMIPPVGSTYSTSDGNIAVLVTGAGPGAPISRIPVMITAPGGQVTTYMTDSNGCAFAAYEPAGSYTAELDMPGYVDTAEDNTLTDPDQTVLASSTLPVLLTYDQGGYVSTSFLSPSGTFPATLAVGTPGGTSIPVTVSNSSMTNYGTVFTIGSDGDGTTPLFPFASPDSDVYDLWAGACPAGNPNAQAMMAPYSYLYPSVVRTAAVNTSISSTDTEATPAAVDVPLYELDTTVLLPGNIPDDDPGLRITATPVDTTGIASCGANLASYGPYLLPATNQTSDPPVKAAERGVSLAALPLGTYNVTATDWPMGTVTRANVTVNGAGATTTSLVLP